MSYNQIAIKLAISETTVKTHVNDLMNMVMVHDKTNLRLLAIRADLAPMPNMDFIPTEKQLRADPNYQIDVAIYDNQLKRQDCVEY